MPAVVTFSHVSKRYQLGLARTSVTGLAKGWLRAAWRGGLPQAVDGSYWALKDVSFELQRGQSLALLGPNGAGKSTLIKCMLNEIKPDKGYAKLGSQVSVGHYRQTHEHLDMTLTVVDYIRRQMPSQTWQDARDLAGAFLFTGNEQEKELGVLSGGERSRTVLAGLVAGAHNLLVLDEPTNHLDIPSAERLEEALIQFTATPEGFGGNARGGGTLILITHDRMLLDNVVNQLVIFDGKGNAKLFWGTYSDYLRSLQEAEAKKAQADAKPQKPQARQEPAQQKKQEPAKPAKSSKNLFPKMSTAQIEKRIIQIEQEVEKIDKELADPATYKDGSKTRTLQERRANLIAERTPLEEEWANRGA